MGIQCPINLLEKLLELDVPFYFGSKTPYWFKKIMNKTTISVQILETDEHFTRFIHVREDTLPNSITLRFVVNTELKDTHKIKIKLLDNDYEALTKSHEEKELRFRTSWLKFETFSSSLFVLFELFDIKNKKLEEKKMNYKIFKCESMG